MVVINYILALIVGCFFLVMCVAAIIHDNNNSLITSVIVFALGVMLIISASVAMSTATSIKTEERTIIRMLNDDIKYDTVSISDDGEIEKIKIIK